MTVRQALTYHSDMTTNSTPTAPDSFLRTLTRVELAVRRDNLVAAAKHVVDGEHVAQLRASADVYQAELDRRAAH